MTQRIPGSGSEVRCVWCQRRENEIAYETASDYISAPELCTSNGRPHYFVHRVQLWGRGTEVLKQCDAAAFDQLAKPSPGSKEAIALGCTCPIIDNSNGAGYLGSGQFWISETCRLHVKTQRKL
jgi:hypothetical protein